MKKRYRTSDGEVYEISDAEVNDFMTDFPDAIEVETYIAEGEEYDISPDEVSAFMIDFPNAVKKKGVSGQGSDPLTQNLPVKNIPAKVQGQAAAKPVKGAAKMAAAGDPFANQQAPVSALTYDPSKVKSAVKAAKEGIEKTYEIAKEGKRKPFYASWNTQQAYSYIKPSIDYTEQMLEQIKGIQDPEIQSIYNELKNINDSMKNQVGQAWNDGWSEETLSKYVGNLAQMARDKANEVDRRMAQLQAQKPTQQEQQAQALFEKEFKVTKPRKQEPLPAKSEQQIKDEQELEAMPDSGLRLPAEGEVEKYLEGRTYAEKRADFESDPYLKERYSSYDEYVALSKLEAKYVGEKVDKEQWGEARELLNEVNTNNQVKIQGERLEQTMGKRHEQIDLQARQENFNKLYNAWIAARSEDPESEETKSLANDLKLAESEYENAYRSLDLDYLESMSATQPTLAKEKIDRYNQLVAKKEKGETLSDTEAQFLLNTRRDASDAFSIINNAKLIKLKEKADLPGYSKGMAELGILMQDILGEKSVLQFASEEISKKAKMAMAPIQQEYGKKRDQLAEYEIQLKNIDDQFKQLEADHQSGFKNQQQYEEEFNQLQSTRNEIYGSYETTYNALEQLNKAMETAITPFNTEMSKLQDPYNSKIQELNNKITELKRKTGVDDGSLAEAEILYRNLATAQQAKINANAQYSRQYYSEEQNKMLEEERKAANSGVTEIGKSVVRGLNGLAFGLMKLPKALGIEDSEKYGVVDEMYDLALQIQYESQGTFGALEGKGVSTYLQYAQSIGEGVASTLTFAATGGLPVSAVATSIATSVILGAGDNYQKGIDAGMDSNTAHFFSAVSSAGQALSELIYKDANVFDDVVGNTIYRNIVKNGLTGKQAFRIALQQAPKNLAKAGTAVSMENLEEVTSLVTDKLTDEATNLVAGKKYFQDNLNPQDFQETIISTSGSTIISRFLFRRSRLDPTSRMALFKSVQQGEKNIEKLTRLGAEASQIAKAKKDLEEAKLQLSVVEGHSNWKYMNDAQKAYAFDLARQLSVLEKSKKSNDENGLRDESVNQEVEQVREELNQALENPQATQEQERTKSNTLEVLEAIKNGEDYPKRMLQHPNWDKLTDEQKNEINSLSEDLEDKQREILSLFEVGVESQTTIDQRDSIQDKIAEILNNPTNDQKDIKGVSGEVGEGQKPVETQPVAGEGKGQAEAGGVLQAQEEIEAKKADIEQRRQQELKDKEDTLDIALGLDGDTRTVEEQINDKYDEELAKLEAPEATTEAGTEEVSPEITKIEQQRAAELEAFENDENITEIDGEQVLLTPDGRITRDTINEKYDKQVDSQKEIDQAVAEVKKQQNPQFQAALRQAIDVDPKASTRAHQIAAQKILDGATATDAMASAVQEAAQETRKEKARRAMEQEGLLTGREDINKAFKNVARALRSTGIMVREPLPPDQFEEERKKAGASDTAEGWFRSKTGEIIFSQEALEKGWGTTIIFHEGTHPILNIVRNTDKKLYDRAVQGLRAAAKAEKLDGKPNPLKDVEAWVKKAAGNKSKEQQDDEFMTETIARIASGDIQIKQLPRTVKEKFIDALNKIAKFMGFKRVFFNSNDTEFRRLANQIATTLARGEKVEGIVGKRNVKKYQANFGAQETTSAIFDNVSAKLAELGIKIGKDKKKVTNFDVGKALKEYYKKKFKSMKIDDFGDKAVDITSDYAVDEILFALDKFGNSSGKGWYTEDFEKALNTLAQIDPDIKNDPKVREIATVVIAIASNSTDVLTNLTRVIYAVDKYKKTGKIPTDVGSGKGASAIATGVSRYNLLLDKFKGDVEKVKQFMQTVGPIKDVRQQLIDLTGKKSFAQVKKDNLATDPEWNDTEVLPGSILIFGPKIGAFYSNLSGLGGTPTIDRWCIRTMYRYRGDMMAKVLPVEMERFKQENGLEGQSDGSVISLVEAHAKLFNDILAGKGEFKGMSKADRNNALKPYRKGSQIAAKITNVVNEISDGLNEKIGNKAQYSKDFRSFTKKVFEEAQKKIKEQTGQDLQISDIQAILWIYEKELFGAMGVNQRPDSTYSSASQRLVDSIKSGVNTVEDFKNGKAKTDQKSAILEEGPMGDLIPMDAGDYMEGLEDQPDRLNEDEDIQNSVPREGDRIGKYDQLPGAPTPKGATGPIPELVDIAESYAKKFGIPYTRQAEYVKVDEEFATNIAKAYEQMRHDPKNPKVKEAYDDLIRQTTDQYNALTDAGYEFTFFDKNTDPYNGNPVDAMRDLRKNKKMAVYGTYDGYGTEGITGANIEDNPMLAPTGLQWPDQAGVMRDVTANDLFRAVHDAFGHGLEGAGFRARGEENAWQAHARLFTGPAVAAITSETRGQNSWLNYGPHGERNRKATLEDTIFAEQKTGLMPDWTWTDNVAPAMEEPKGDQRISDALGIEDVIQPSEQVGRGARDVNDVINELKTRNKNIKTQSDNGINRLSQEEELGRTRGGQANVQATNVAIRVHRAGKENGWSEKKVKQEEELAIEEIAKKNGYFVDESLIKQKGEKDANGAESIVFFDDENTVMKITENQIHHASWLDFFDRLSIHNYLFPETAYTVLGFTRLNGTFSIITNQPLIRAEGVASSSEISEDMKQRGFTSRGMGRFHNLETGVFIGDVFHGNVLKSEGGNLFYIDPVIKIDSNEPSVKTTRTVKLQEPTASVDESIQPSDAGRGERTEYTQALDEMGFTEEQIQDWKKENSVSQKQTRVPGVQESAQAVYEGKKDVYEHMKTVQELQPIKPFKSVPKIPSFLDIVASLKSNQVATGIVGLTKSIPDGERVGLRLDIPAYENYDTWVVSLHESAGDTTKGPSIGYGKTGVIRNVNFKSESAASLAIARGKSSKTTIARMFGDWVNESPESVHDRAEQLMNNPDWVQVGMNPFRHSWFYDKKDGMPLSSAEEVLQVGALVLAKNPRKFDLNNEQDRAEFEERFKVKTPTGDIVQFSDASRYEKSDIPDLIERAMNGIDADLAKGISLEEAIQRNITNQPWYSMVNDRQRKSIQSVIESTYDEEIASMAAPEAETSEPTVKSSVAALAAEVEKLYYEVRDGSRSERVSAKARIEQMLLGNPKLSYIYKNISLINEQLETRGLLTKSIGCP
jgi:hypothetical protein